MLVDRGGGLARIWQLTFEREALGALLAARSLLHALSGVALSCLQSLRPSTAETRVQPSCT